MLLNPKMNHKIVRRMKVINVICDWKLLEGRFGDRSDFHHTLRGEVKNFNWRGGGRGPFFTI